MKQREFYQKYGICSDTRKRFKKKKRHSKEQICLTDATDTAWNNTRIQPNTDDGSPENGFAE